MISILLLVLSTSIAKADPVAATVAKGETVPFSGTLLNNEAAAAVLSQSALESDRCKILTDLEVKKKTIEYERDLSIMSKKNDACVLSLSQTSAQNVDLTNKYNRSITMRPYIFSAGLVGGVAMTLLISLAINGVSQ